MAPFLLARSVPRRSRLLLITVLLGLAILLFPGPRTRLSEAVFFLLFPPGFGGGGSRSSFSGSSWRGDVLDYVNPLIGTTNGGHVFPGATLPYGMAKAVADTDSHAENAAGYVSDTSNIVGFSHMHDSGTGGLPSMGNFPLFVHPGCPGNNFSECQFSRNERRLQRIQGSAQASPGYFAIELENSVRAEMTTTNHAALYRFKFPGTAEVRTRDGLVPYSPLVLADLRDLASTMSSEVVSVDPETGRIVGQGKYRPSFGTGSYEAYFCADFRGAAIRHRGVFVNNAPHGDDLVLDTTLSVTNMMPGHIGGWVQFEPPRDNALLARVGMSFISNEQACQNAEREIPDFDFTLVQERARDTWRDKLSVIEVDHHGVSEDLLTTFWSGLYRTMLSPQNYTGENQLWESKEPYFDSFYCIWDSFRAQHPLLTIIDPEAQTQMVRALLDIYRFDRKLPDCRMSFCKGFTQGGSNADVVITDAWLKNITDEIDWETAYEAVVSDAEVEPKNWGLEGRGSLESWHELGYIPWDDKDMNGTGPMSRSISRGLEYAYDDFCISTLARALGHHTDAQKYLNRSANWKNYWRADAPDANWENPLMAEASAPSIDSTFMGFPQPRLKNGSWHLHNTRLCSPLDHFHSCYYDTIYDTYEGSPWLYAFFVPQDMSGLIGAMGGQAAFVERLTYFHTSGLAYIGNEQTFLPVFQFHYGARPGLSAYWAHQYVPAQFNASTNGIPGNDDCAMGAFSAFVLMGFFPVAGQDVYLLTPPFFREVRIRARESGRYAVLRVKNFDPTYRAIYIQSATLDGKPYHRSWITHSFFVHGGVLEFVVGRTESEWGTLDQDLPPSFPFYNSRD